MDTSDYNAKINQLLSDETCYKKVKNDPTKSIIASTQKLILQHSEALDLDVKYLIPSCAKPPALYGLPKIHKQDTPLRPIVSQIDSPTYKLAQHVAKKKLSGYLIWNESFYKQVNGVAMGSPVSLVVADIFMEDFEKTALSSSPVTPRFYKRPTCDVIELSAPRFDSSPRRSPAPAPRPTPASRRTPAPRCARNLRKRTPPLPRGQLARRSLSLRRTLPPGCTPILRRPKHRGSGEARGLRRQRTFRRVVPNPRLYRPPPERAPPPSAAPLVSWLPPSPPARPLDTASRAALRLTERRRLEITPSPAPHYVSTSERSHNASSRRNMESINRNSTSEECSDSGDTLSAPSEYLAEFLSAIMRRQYPEALAYCRLILQYEPHNATARGFYPLLQHKARDSHSDSRGESPDGASCGSQSSLELDSSGDASRSDTDDNGNVPPTPSAATDVTTSDIQNDNAPHESESAAAASLRRLRAHFTHSVK